MSAWDIPRTLNILGSEWDMNTDFRAVLDILKHFNDPGYEPDEKWEICLSILLIDYEPYSGVSAEWKQEAMKKALEFIDMGMKEDGKKHPRLMDWENDAAIIIPSINRVLGKEVRSTEYLHWWTFLGAYMEIGESLFSQVLNIRNKQARGKRLEKWERDFYKENRKLIEMDAPKKERSTEEKKELCELFGIKR